MELFKKNKSIKKIESNIYLMVGSLVNKCIYGNITFEHALKILLSEEKTQRKIDSQENTTYIILATAQLCQALKKWKILEIQIASIVKRHGQFRLAIQKLIQQCIPYTKEIININDRISFINVLLTVTQGKMYLEYERACLTMEKCRIFEFEKKNLKKAAEIVEDLQVETFRSIKRKEKTEYILEQLRLFLSTKDPKNFIHAKILTNHIGIKTLKSFPDLALKFYRLNTEIYFKEKEFLKMAKTLLDLENLSQNDLKNKKSLLKEAVMACILSKHTKEQHKLLLFLKKNELIQSMVECRELLKRFTTFELIRWPDDPKLEKFVEKFTFSTKFYDNQKLNTLFEHRIVQHNIRTISQYYTQIEMKQLAKFLRVNIYKMEKFLSAMIVSGELFASIDRLSEVISFKKKQAPEKNVDQWNLQINKLIHIVEATSHQINRETMLQKVSKKII